MPQHAVQLPFRRPSIPTVKRGSVDSLESPQKASTALLVGVTGYPKTVALGGDVSSGVVHVHRIGAQSLDTVTTTARAVVATIKRSVVSVDGGRVLMRLAGRHARVRVDHREHAAPPGLRRPICFRGKPSKPAEQAISEGA